MRRVLRSILLVAALAVLLGGAAFVIEHETSAGGTYLSDDRGIHVPASDAPMRRILWSPAVGLGDTINSAADEYEPYLSPDGNLLLFVRGRPGGSADIYASRRTHGGWAPPVRLEISSDAHDELGPCLSPDGTTLYFASDRPGGAGGYDLWACDIDASLRCGNPRNLGDRVNTPFDERKPTISPDGALLVFASNRVERASGEEAWTATLREQVRNPDSDLYAGTLTAGGISAVRAIEALSTDAREGAPAFSPGGDFLYFASDRDGDLDIYRVRLTPGDGVFSIRHAIERVEAPISGPSRDLDPTIAHLGFALVFSSDRSRAGATDDASVDFDLYLSTAREVYASVETMPIDWASMLGTALVWLLWLLLLLLLVLLLVRLLRRVELRERYRRLSLLARCLLVSMLVHLLLLAAVGAWRLGTALGDAMDRSGAARVAIMSRDGTTDLASQIRGRLTSVAVRPLALATNAPMPALASIEPLEIRAMPGDTRAHADAMVHLPAQEAMPGQTPRVEDGLSDEQEIRPPVPDAPVPSVAGDEPTVRVGGHSAQGAQDALPKPLDEPAPVEPVPNEPSAISLAPLVEAVADGRIRDDDVVPAAPDAVDASHPIALGTPVAHRRQLEDDAGLLVRAPEAAVDAPEIVEEVRVRKVALALSATIVPDGEVAWSAGSVGGDARVGIDTTRQVLMAMPVSDMPRIETPSQVPQEVSSEGTLTIRPTLGNALQPAETPSPVSLPVQSAGAHASVIRLTEIPVALHAATVQGHGGPVRETALEPEVVEGLDISVGMPSEPADADPTEEREHDLEIRIAAGGIGSVPVSPDGLCRTARVDAIPVASQVNEVPRAVAGVADARPAPDLSRPGIEGAVLPMVISDHSALPASPEDDARMAMGHAEERSLVVAPSMDTDVRPVPAHEAAAFETVITHSAPQMSELVEMAVGSTPGEAEASARRPVSSSLEPIIEDVSLGLPTPGEVAAPAHALAQRSPEVRRELLEDLGGSELTELGVELALDWLARHQMPDGSWSGHDYDALCGSCDGASREDEPVALTALSTLAFLGADFTHRTPSPYRRAVADALDWLVERQGEDGDLSGVGDIHAHAIATLALGEALQMTQDRSLRDPLARAVAYIETYHASTPDPWKAKAPDEPVLAWQVMALISARRAGIEIPDTILDAARDRLDDLVIAGTRGVYAPRPGVRPTRIATAEGAFARRLLGYARQDRSLEESARVLARDNIEWDEANSTTEWSMTTLALFQHQGPLWAAWNTELVETLLSHQETGGRQAGSWEPRDERSAINGRVHQTAMGALMLETYYRYLPGFMDDEAVDRGVVRGRVLDAETAMPLSGALVRLDLAGRAPLVAVTRDDGRYTLRPGAVPEHVALTATRRGYEPASVSIPTQRLASGIVERDIRLSRESLGEVALERQPRVHHLGNNEFTGRINSQFQRRSEGLVFRATFTLTREQIEQAAPIVYLRLLAKGAQAPNPVRINGHRLARRLTDSPRDGSFGEWTGRIERAWLIEGENTLEIRSVRGEADLDDFEFVNIRLFLQPDGS